MYSNTYRAWAGASMDAWALCLEASEVISLRMAKVAAGGKAANDEILLMICEKMRSAAELQADAASGRSGHSPLAGARHALRHYRRKVAANRHRLS